MQIIDAQIHLWGSGLPSNMSHRRVTHFTPEEAIRLMDEAGVDAAVIHPPGWDPGSTEMAFAAVRNYPLRDHGRAAARSTRVPQPHCRLERAAGHARFALWLPRRPGAALAA